ncbi:adenylate cyclase, germination specific-like [Maniola jurtina]|uniref:adenylate cyclase, germination specific-like n=1 Tax=Maniola jurtina TaxID=191418 RepID=UPI001E68779C|nr:adenylate cyclase, germination specific-like [Maniola jurtina]
MTSHALKVDNWSHCTTPSDRNGPQLVSVKVGCFHINPASIRGRRLFLLQMVVLCFVPHVALILQNCSIMAQLSQTFDSSLYLDNEVNRTLSLGEMVLAIEDERVYVSRYLFADMSTDDLNIGTLERVFVVTDRWLGDEQSPVPDRLKMSLYDFREEVLHTLIKAKESLKRISIYQQINAILLNYMMKNVKSTKSPLWRKFLACYELVKTMDELSITIALVKSVDLKLQVLTPLQQHMGSVLEHMQSTLQYLEVEGVDDAVVLREIFDFYKASDLMTSKASEINTNKSMEVSTNYIRDTNYYLDKMKDVQIRIWHIVRESASSEVWAARRTLGLGVGVLCVVLLASPILMLLLRHTVYTLQIFTESIEHSTQQLMAEKQKSDLLLSRMLPMPVLRRLRAQRAVPAEAFDAVTIYFSDIVGFTNIAANSTPMEIINMLNMLYRMFDDKIMQYNVYKVETIGDAYMVVSGLPQRNGNRHVSEIADMALSLMRSVKDACVPHRPDEPLRIRAGINTGSCVAGVVGATMPRYCLFGDTINTASRMESTGEAMKIHISQSTKEALEKMGKYIMESRGIVEVPGKGEMETFWLVGKVGPAHLESPRPIRLQDYDQNVLEMLIK